MEWNMPNNIEREHREQYEEEKKARWEMAKVGEANAMKEVCRLLSEKFKTKPDDITFERYDELWFEQYDIEDQNNEWVKGASDYLIKIQGVNEQYSLLEIKLKSQEYRKTQWGGKTPNGTPVPKYGCTSYYLDIIPVWRNMNDFVEHVGIEKQSFIVAFVKEDLSEIMFISLAKINDLVSNGWKKDKNTKITLGTFSEGYGREAYLIPKDSTKNIVEITSENFLTSTTTCNPYPNPSNQLS